MDARLKQRLVGAAVLLALIVIVVPMFFSGHEQGGSATTSVSLGIPAQPQPPQQSKTFALGAPTPATSAPTVSATTAGGAGAPPAAPGAMPTVTIPGTPAEVGSTALPRPAPGMPAPAQAPTSANPSTATGAVSAAAHAAPLAAPAAAAQRPMAAPMTTLPPGTAAQLSYIVSLGAYTDLGNARALAGRVRKLGVPVGEQALRVAGKPALRIYAGPYANRALAEAARLRIHAAEPRTTAVLVAQSTTLQADQPAADLPAGRAGGWVVQLGAFDNPATADSLKTRVFAAGFPAYTDTIHVASGTLWRVRVGPEASRDGALALRAQIKAKLGQDGIVAVAH